MWGCVMALIRSCRLGAVLFAIAFATFALSAAPPAGAATTTLGQLGGAPSACQAGLDAVQTSVSAGTSYTVPAGSWLVTSWSTHAGDGPAPSGSLQLEIWRTTAIADEYSLVGISAVETTTASGTNTFAVSPPIAVEGGDLLGLRNLTQDYGCANVGGPGLTSPSTNATAPVPGEVRTLPPFPLGVTLNVSATLSDSPELQIRKVVSGPSSSGFTAQVHCTTPVEDDAAATAVDASLAFAADGAPDPTSTPAGWIVRNGAWVFAESSLNGSTCTATETAKGGAQSVSYACSWRLAESENPENVGCPGASDGPRATPASVTFHSDGEVGVLTITNTFPTPPPPPPPPPSVAPLPVTVTPKFTG
jgi:hypothetical protein